MSVTPEKYHPRKIIAEIVPSPKNVVPTLRKFQNWQINLIMKYQNLQRTIILIARKIMNITNTSKNHQP